MNRILTVSQVLELIAPVDPDNVHHVGQGVYEARWLRDHPASAVECFLLARTPQISADEPTTWPNGTVIVRFRVEAEAMSQEHRFELLLSCGCRVTLRQLTGPVAPEVGDRLFCPNCAKTEIIVDVTDTGPVEVDDAN